MHRLHLYPPCCRCPAAQPDEATTIDINEPVALTFALRYLNSFAKVLRLLGCLACRSGAACCPSA